jgi:membrane protein required for colicin V production
MNGFDVVLAGLAGTLALVGLWKGLARIAIGLVALVAAFVVAARFHEAFAERLTWIAESDEPRRLAAYLLLFLGTMLVGAVVAWLGRKLLQVAMLGWADRLAGAAVGLAAAVLLAALVVLPVVAYAPTGEAVLRESTLAPWVTVVADVARAVVPEGMSRRYRERVERLRRDWHERWAAHDGEAR